MSRAAEPRLCSSAMTVQVHTRAWRGWLYASLPLVCLFAPAALFWAHELQPSPTSLPFTLDEYSYFIPFPTRVAMVSPFVAAIVLAAVFFRWGRLDRPALKRSLLLVALPWLVGSLHMLGYWRYGVLWMMAEAGGFGVGTLTASAGELFALAASMAGASALLFISLLGVLTLDALGVGLMDSRPEAARRFRFLSRPAVLVIVGLALASALCASLSSSAATAFFAAIAEEGLAGWSAALDDAAVRWAWLHGAQIVTAVAALLGLVALLRREHAAHRSVRMKRSSLVLAAALLGLVHGAGVLCERTVLYELAHFLETTGVSTSAQLLTGEGEPVSYSLRPALSVNSQRLQLPGPRAVTWAGGVEHVREELAAYRQLQSIRVSGAEELPLSLVVGVGQGTSLTSVHCLADVASGLGMVGLDLATGPQHDVPVSTRRALGFVSPSLGHAFSQTVGITPLRFSRHGCEESEAEHRWALELGPPTGPDDATNVLAAGCRGHWDCIEVRLADNATMPDLLRLLQGAGRNAEVSFARSAAPGCR